MVVSKMLQWKGTALAVPSNQNEYMGFSPRGCLSTETSTASVRSSNGAPVCLPLFLLFGFFHGYSFLGARFGSSLLAKHWFYVWCTRWLYNVCLGCHFYSSIAHA